MTAVREYTQPVVIGREEFARDYFDYKAGEHVVFGGPTQRGKTTLAFKLLEYCATQDVPAYVAVSKPRDPVTDRESRRLGFRRVSDWPVPKQLKEVLDSKQRPRGYVIWPKFGDMDNDVQRAAEITSRLLRDRYAQGVRNKRGILVMDDTMVKAKILGLDRHMTTMLAMSGAMGIGEWVFVQKPTDSGSTPIWAYGASEHVFLTRDPDDKSRQRYDEIGGVDRKVVSDIVQRLGPFQFLYLKRTENYMCVVDRD